MNERVSRTLLSTAALPVLAATLALCPALAEAQSQSGALSAAANQAPSNFRRDRNIGVRNRARPEYQAAGVNVGGFVLRPRIDASAAYDDNVFATPSKDGDVVLNARPEVDLESNWSNHMIGIRGRLDAAQYLDNTSLNVVDALAGLRGRYDLAPNSDISALVQYSRNTQPRTASATLQNTREPIRYNEFRSEVRATREFNRLRLIGTAGFNDYNFDDVLGLNGARLDQDFRDRSTVRVEGRVDYAVSPDTAVFVDLSLTQRDYRHAPVGGFERDSRVVQALVGSNLQLTPVIRAELGVGYLSQDYDDVRLTDVDGFGFRGELEWFPTQLTTVSLNGSRSIEESGILGSAGIVSTRVGGRVDHELWRNLLLGLQADYSNDDYQNFDRRDRRSSLLLEGRYLLSRRAAISASYVYLKQDSSGAFPGADFVDNRVGVTLTLNP